MFVTKLPIIVWWMRRVEKSFCAAEEKAQKDVRSILKWRSFWIINSIMGKKLVSTNGEYSVFTVSLLSMISICCSL